MSVFDYSPAVAADPEAYRIHAREESYPNSVAEQTEIKRVDDAVFDRVRVYENSLVGSSQALVERGTVLTRETTQVEQSIREEVEYALDHESRTDLKQVAARYTALHSRAQQKIDELERLAREAEWLAEKAEDPYGAYRSLVVRYPALSKKY
ncbi:hypothetical protein DEJ03_12690 [Curtobacterium sp. MCLR17_043]|uniref:hypothetical protein n=1 Tax=Curtobacterium sp. MCLR17_043 TaxID=2175627 RepID=UPI000D9B4DA5|nr:hypothetical protein [Curtobacterium sp. MCLR17_043]PYY44018.1 hypothetical protein DEJ03_12690 [Curtobacterium sp. MCLR17_043]